ncbi:UDP-N-acetylglucosamine 2-epimerase (non-hydrolyzing) [Erythrobacteraceae bacterium CFH 75059]|uniref:non-hydrolyzing UDP-N-acetylglucosamine 2-epimerase n=1 Tax=Qipengyuania thermophila TaxID=2509361 RepID=UPI0010205631|nr:UDP-N-acetylglucosamine 2-epimerase (non-hydrolyzing) [Qipengyuania thermophila]TCD06721.1 UDP-N-acetylglucosamine 2-epimerase (non-hydrolyzing) [Erythrobacteraceae bacterium CFH 75059]
MASRRTILTVFGTRPEAIKLFPLVHALRGDARFTPRVCVSGQHRAMLDPVLDFAGIRPDHDLAVMRDGQGLDRLFCSVLAGVGALLDRERPDSVVVQGDTTTALAGALAAFHRKIPVVHVEAGLRSDDLGHPWPEEGNRKAITALAAVHCAPTTGAAETLRRENVPAGQIHVTGNTGIDALLWTLDRLAEGADVSSATRSVLDRREGRHTLLVTAHRREALGDGLHGIVEAVAALADRPDVTVIWPVHLNPAVRAVVHHRLGAHRRVHLLDPLSYPDMAAVMRASTLLLTDSGGLQEEAPALGLPVLVLRDTTERPEAVAAGTAQLVGTRSAPIVAAASRLLDDAGAYRRMARAHSPFGDGRASQRIADLLAA